MSQYESLWKEIVEGLKSHPEGLVAFSMAISAIALVAAGVNQWLACGFPSAIYIAYCVRGLRSDTSKERLAETRVKEIEATEGQRVRKRLGRKATTANETEAKRR
jgi:hypothetical protein